MEKLKVVTEFFDKLRVDDDDTEYTEDLILETLNKVNLLKFENVEDIPTRMVNEILSDITDLRAPRLDANQEQEMLDFFEEIVVNGATEIPIIAKSLRYLLRTDKSSKCALIVVDVQNDFISGSLALRNTPEEVVEIINSLVDNDEFHSVFYSFDWHPENHCSFAKNVSLYPIHESSPVTAENAVMYDKVIYDGDKALEQVLWPAHCVQDSEGAELHPDLKVTEDAIKIYKGQLPQLDSYSALWDNGRISRTELLAHLFDLDITHIFICGLALDYCVGMSAIDIAEHGFDVYVIEDACRGVAEDTVEAMKEKIIDAGVELIQATDVCEKISELKA